MPKKVLGTTRFGEGVTVCGEGGADRPRIGQALNKASAASQRAGLNRTKNELRREGESLVIVQDRLVRGLRTYLYPRDG